MARRRWQRRCFSARKLHCCWKSYQSQFHIHIQIQYIFMYIFIIFVCVCYICVCIWYTQQAAPLIRSATDIRFLLLPSLQDHTDRLLHGQFLHQDLRPLLVSLMKLCYHSVILHSNIRQPTQVGYLTLNAMRLQVFFLAAECNILSFFLQPRE